MLPGRRGGAGAAGGARPGAVRALGRRRRRLRADRRDAAAAGAARGAGLVHGPGLPGRAPRRPGAAAGARPGGRACRCRATTSSTRSRGCTSELAEVRAVLTDPGTSVRLVLTPEAVVVAEARRRSPRCRCSATASTASSPTGSSRADGATRGAAGWVAAQAAQLAEVEASFAPLPVLRRAVPAGRAGRRRRSSLTFAEDAVRPADDPFAALPARPDPLDGRALRRRVRAVAGAAVRRPRGDGAGPHRRRAGRHRRLATAGCSRCRARCAGAPWSARRCATAGCGCGSSPTRRSGWGCERSERSAGRRGGHAAVRGRAGLGARGSVRGAASARTSRPGSAECQLCPVCQLIGRPAYAAGPRSSGHLRRGVGLAAGGRPCGHRRARARVVRPTVDRRRADRHRMTAGTRPWR